MTNPLLNPLCASRIDERVALFGLLFFGLLGPFGPAAAALALSVILGASLWQWRAACAALWRDPVFWAFVVLAIHAFVRAGFAASQFPATADNQWEQAGDLILPILLLPVAWWLRGDPRRVITLLTLALIGYCTHLLIEVDWARIPELLLEGRRADVTDTKLATALYTGAGILGLIAFGPRIVRAVSRLRAGLRLASAAGFIAIAVVLMTAQLITQSRAVWLPLVVLVPILLALHWRTAWRSGINHRRAATVAAIVVAIVVGTGVFAANTIADRLTSESEVIVNIATGDLSEVGYSSIGARVHMVQFGVELIAERPVFGWGPGTDATRFLASRHGWDRLEPYGDLHNTWLQITVRLGFVGLAIYAALIALFLRSAWRGYRSGAMPRDLALFLGSALLLTGAWTLINTRILNPDFQYFIMLLFAVMHTFARAREGEAGREATGWTHPAPDDSVDTIDRRTTQG